MRFLPLFLTVICLQACGGGGGGGNGSASECSPLNARIFNGDVCNQEARTPVLALFPISSDGTHYAPAGICTAELVTLNKFVTSAHCFVGPIVEFGRLIVGFAVVAGGSNGEVFAVVNPQLHPLYGGDVGSPFDVAMGTLDGTPSPPIGPISLLLSTPTVPSDSVTAYGYGTNNNGEVGELKAAKLTVEAVVGGNLAGSLQTSGASLCPGDSGGPLVKVDRGVASLVGVNSFGLGGTCQGQGIPISGFVDIQTQAVADFILGYAPDAAVR